MIGNIRIISLFRVLKLIPPKNFFPCHNDTKYLRKYKQNLLIPAQDCTLHLILDLLVTTIKDKNRNMRPKYLVFSPNPHTYFFHLFYQSSVQKIVINLILSSKN